MQTKNFNKKIFNLLLMASFFGAAFLSLAANSAQAQTTFSNPAPITIPLTGPATPYPSDIAVSGLTGGVSKVTVTLTNMNHTFPDDIDILLVSPSGAKVLLMSDAGGTGDLVNVNLSFDDAATAGLPDAPQITTGTYRPTNFDTTTDVFPAPAPAAPYSAALSAFIGSNPNGNWSLFVRDDAGGDQGSIQGGWSITISTAVGPGTLQFSSSTFTGVERTTANVTVTRDNGFDGTVTVNYTTSSGTATGGAACTPGVDFINTSGTLTFGPNELSKTIPIQLCTDDVADNGETINITLSNPTGGATLGTPSTAILTITDCTQIAYSTTLRFPSTGVTENQLISFCVNSPGTILSDVPVGGLNTANAEYLQSIDFRPANGQLYGLIVQNNAATGATGTIRLVTVDTATGATTQVGSPITGVLNPGNFTGFDFNPVADRIRVTRILSAARDDNFRINPNDGTITQDTPLAFAAGDPNAGDDEFIVGSAYTNNAAGATSTTLYNIDTSQDLLVRQGDIGGTPTSPNTGQLFTVGALGVNSSGLVGFDITANNEAYAILDTALGTGGISITPGRLYSINLTTGAATLIGTVGGPTNRATSSLAIPPSNTPVGPSRTRFDFDGDGKADISVFRPSNGVWYLQQSTAGSTAINFGQNGDLIAPADYDGDGKTDIAVFRPSNGTWYMLRSQAGFTGVQFGANGDLPRPGDFDGDQRADLAVFRPSTGTWFIRQSSNSQDRSVQFGQANDVPMIVDFDGDGRSDISVFRPSNGTWYWLRSSDSQFQFAQFGQSGDIPLSGNFTGDNRSDLAVFRPSNGTWYVARGTGVPAQNFDTTQFGASTDTPVPADYDGDGRDNIAVYRPSVGNWYIYNSTTVTGFGAPADKPVPSAYQP